MASPVKSAWQLANGLKYADTLYHDTMKYAANLIKEKKAKEITECAKGFEV